MSERVSNKRILYHQTLAGSIRRIELPVSREKVVEVWGQLVLDATTPNQIWAHRFGLSENSIYRYKKERIFIDKECTIRAFP